MPQACVQWARSRWLKVLTEWPWKVQVLTGGCDFVVCAALAHSKGSAGFVTKVTGDLDACFVKWDTTEEECGWYRCGAYGWVALRIYHGLWMLLCVYIFTRVEWLSGCMLAGIIRCTCSHQMKKNLSRSFPCGTVFCIYFRHACSWTQLWEDVQYISTRLIRCLVPIRTGYGYDDHWRQCQNRYWKSVCCNSPTNLSCDHEPILSWFAVLCFEKSFSRTLIFLALSSNMDYREKNGMYADNLVVSLFDMFGM